MALLFSYGSLQRAEVQHAAFGRLFDGMQDALVAFELVPPAPGVSPHANVIRSNRNDCRVPGTAFEVTEAELAAADEYERRDGYVRIAATLASGKSAWVYVDAGPSGR